MCWIPDISMMSLQVQCCHWEVCCLRSNFESAPYRPMVSITYLFCPWHYNWGTPQNVLIVVGVIPLNGWLAKGSHQEIKSICVWVFVKKQGGIMCQSKPNRVNRILEKFVECLHKYKGGGGARPSGQNQNRNRFFLVWVSVSGINIGVSKGCVSVLVCFPNF